MKELTIEEKIAEIKSTSNYQDVKNAWFPPYYEKEYYFVSYSHKDYKLVYESLHRLQSGKKRLNLWYDHNLTPGRDWEIEARRYIYDFNCKGVIFFLSENAVLSQSIHKEIEFVKNSGKSYLSINLPCEKIKGHIGKYLPAAQMLELLKQQGYEIENYEDKSAVLNETFNSKITYLPFNEDIESQIDKILSLKRQPLLNIFDSDSGGIVTSINDINVTEIKREDFDYFNERNERKTAAKVGPCAFANCKYLSKIELPERLRFIGRFAFYNCISLKEINSPVCLSVIETEAFYGCNNLKSIYIPIITEKIAAQAFAGCRGLECIIVDKNNKKYYSRDGILYNRRKTKILHIPKAIKGKIIIPQGVTSISDGAFWNCTSLESVTLENNSKLTSIGDYAFRDCTRLTSIIIPDGVTSIGDGAFWDCTSLESVTLENNSKLTSIGDYAFRDCTRLTSIIIPDGVTSIGVGAFWGCPSLKVNIADIAKWCNIDFGYNFLKYVHSLHVNNQLVTKLNIPQGVTKIKDCAFCGCTSLKSVTFSDSVITIGRWTFWDCTNLESITLSHNVNRICMSSFRACGRLDDIFYNGTMQQWKSIKKYIDWDSGTPDYTVHCTDGDLKKGEF